MPDTKITALTALTAADPANDVLPIVDVSDTTMAASGTTKKISINNVLGASGTATLASATITGDLTVRTNKLAVTSTNVGIGTTGPTLAAGVGLEIENAGITTLRLQNTSGANAFELQVDSDANGVLYRGYNNSPHVFYVNNSTAMTLNSTGLGVGGSPTRKLSIVGSGATYANINSGDNTSLVGLLLGGTSTPSAGQVVYDNTANSLSLFTSGSSRLLIDSSGNVGIGVTPSAWAAGAKALQISSFVHIAQQSNGSSNVGFACYESPTNAFKYSTTGDSPTLYSQLNGQHKFYTAPSGTAGNAITWTQAMTLAANGQLLLGTSTTTGSVDIGMVLNKPSATGYVGNVYQLNGVEKAFTYISSAAGAFRVDTVTGYTINMVSATNGVYLANGGTSWTAISDERFKDIIEPISNAVAKVGSIRSVIGKFKTESEGTRRSFLIAQDVQAVLPEAVDASNPEKLGVSYTEVIPLLVAAIKELTAEVNALKNA